MKAHMVTILRNLLSSTRLRDKLDDSKVSDEAFELGTKGQFQWQMPQPRTDFSIPQYILKLKTLQKKLS